MAGGLFVLRFPLPAQMPPEEYKVDSVPKSRHPQSEGEVQWMIAREAQMSQIDG